MPSKPAFFARRRQRRSPPGNLSEQCLTIFIARTTFTVSLFSCTLPGWLLDNPKFQVIRPVVRSVSVLVVNSLAGLEWPSKYLFHHKAVFRNVLSGGYPDSPVALVSFVLNPSFPFRIVRPNLVGHGAGLGTKLLAPIPRSELGVAVSTLFICPHSDTHRMLPLVVYCCSEGR